MLADGVRVTGLGRSRATAQKVLPDIDWLIQDLSDLTHAEAWATPLEGITCVVNCSGALQDGPLDDLETVHHLAIAALAQVCAARDIPLIQISAVGAAPDAPTQFMASKGRGDAAIRNSGIRYAIFRPGLVLAPHAYGGTALLRMLAAMPLVHPIALPDAQIQTVASDDIADAVCAALRGELPERFECDLVEDEAHSLHDVVAAHRHWLGFGAARITWVLPAFVTSLTAKVADGLSYLGWRSPMRSTALAVLSDGVRGEPGDMFPVKSLQATLRSMPATVEDRLHARLSLLMPVLVATLALFWALSGLIGFARIYAASQVLVDVGWPAALAAASVAFWSAVDLALAAAILVRRAAKQACMAMIIVSIFYLSATTVFVPHLWLDPLGPMVKVLPGIALAMVTRVALETR
jgi:uncharacterized protein YbjT (DUF2867 family)